MPGTCLLLAVLAAAQEDAPAPEIRSFPAEAGRAAGHLYVPKERAEGKTPVLVALPDEATPAKAFLLSLKPLADEGGYALFCPEPADLRFKESDFGPVVAAAEKVRDGIGGGPLFLYGLDDSALLALTLAFTRPKTFRAVVALGAEAPAVKPARGAEALRVLILKAADDRPEAARESIEAVRDSLEVADFRAVAGDGRALDPAARGYVIQFLDQALGRAAGGRDKSLPWRQSAAGLAEAKQKKLPALVYFFDEAPAFAAKTQKIEREALFDPRIRRAADRFVPVLAPRAEAETLCPTRSWARVPRW